MYLKFRFYNYNTSEYESAISGWHYHVDINEMFEYLMEENYSIEQLVYIQDDEEFYIFDVVEASSLNTFIGVIEWDFESKKVVIRSLKTGKCFDFIPNRKLKKLGTKHDYVNN